jgi:RNA polymerase sigma factor (sigma-70 family)
MKAGINQSDRLRQGDTMEISDHELLEGLRTGDGKLLSVLYRKYYVMVLKLVLNNSGREEEARDIYQDTILVLYENVQKRDFVLSCALQTYVYSVARRLWLKQLRRNGRLVLLREEAERESPDAAQAVEEHLEKETEIERMNESLAALGEPCLTLITDYYVKRLSMEEIAEKFGYTGPDTAKNQKYKCLQRLKKRFFNKQDVQQQ